MNRRIKKKREKKHLMNIAAVVRDMIEVRANLPKEKDSIVNTTAKLAERRKTWQTNRWRAHTR